MFYTKYYYIILPTMCWKSRKDNIGKTSKNENKSPTHKKWHHLQSKTLKH